MSERTLQTESETIPEKQPATTAEPAGSQQENQTMGWRPRVHSDYESNTNPFENFDTSGGSVLDGASLNRTVAIRDATEDTAPLQGSKDLSDEDYLGTVNNP